MCTKKLQILGSLLSTDATLSIEGQAADAKAVGEKIEEIRDYYIAPHTIEEFLNDEYKVAGIVYRTNLEDLISGRTYQIIIPKYTPPEGYTSFTDGSWECFIKCDDGSEKLFHIPGDRMMVSKAHERKWYLYNESGFDDTYSYIDLTDKSTASNIIVETKMKYIIPGNNIEYIPTTDYSPATKKYVDDAASSIPEQVQADWKQIDETSVDFIKNKPEIATDDDVINALIEIDLLSAIADSDGAILTDESENILLW